MAWKGTRPEPVRNRDQAVLNYLATNGPSSRNTIAEALQLSRSLTYLSLHRLRDAKSVKKCVSEQANDILWTSAVEEPCQ